MPTVNPLRFTSTRAEKRRAARALKKVAVEKQLQQALKKRWSVFNRATRRLIERGKIEFAREKEQ